jgi:hypothetical protein
MQNSATSHNYASYFSCLRPNNLGLSKASICGLLNVWTRLRQGFGGASKAMIKKSETEVQPKDDEKTEAILHDFKGLDRSHSKMFTQKTLLLFALVALLGVGAGYLLAHKGAPSSITSMNVSGGSSGGGAVEGSNDLSTFKDTAEGTLQQGGIDGEGQFHLVRPGGDSQNVYLVSSIVDLSKYENKKVKVWGQTQQAQHAGWLMDVGRVQAL